uniref:Uncharacterized protein n=1 Tax=Meloidogyne javanica TaxID=6303 RepID=A0A915NBW4_MELJA
MLKLFEWLRNLTPLQREKVLCFLAIGFKRYAAQFINGLEERQTNRKNHRNIPTKNTNLSIYLALQLKKNAFLFSSQQKILPRSPPFNCPKCGFSSRRLRPVMRHLCTRRAHEYKNVVHTATLGFRSRCRDALAIMERIPYPQRIKYLENDEKEKELFLRVSNKLKQPKTLSEMDTNVNKIKIKSSFLLISNILSCKIVAKKNTDIELSGEFLMLPVDYGHRKLSFKDVIKVEFMDNSEQKGAGLAIHVNGFMMAQLRQFYAEERSKTLDLRRFIPPIKLDQPSQHIPTISRMKNYQWVVNDELQTFIKADPKKLNKSIDTIQEEPNYLIQQRPITPPY